MCEAANVLYLRRRYHYVDLGIYTAYEISLQSGGEQASPFPSASVSNWNFRGKLPKLTKSDLRGQWIDFQPPAEQGIMP